MRAMWKGSISFGLINIPVKMYAVAHEREFKFVLLHKKDHSQVRYARICKEEEKEILWDEIVKGYEYKPGEFVTLDEDDFKKANLTKSKSIEILDFVKESEIDTVYYSKPYFLEPEKNADKPYALLREALNQSKKVGIAKFVIHNREHVAVIKPYKDGIVLNELRYSDEVEIPEALNLPKKMKTAPKEIEIAVKLIDHMTAKFKPEKYKDTYDDELRTIINKKAKGKKIHAKGQEPKATKVQDIMSLLKKSLGQDIESKSKKKKVTKRKTA